MISIDDSLLYECVGVHAYYYLTPGTESVNTAAIRDKQNEILKSSAMWMVSYFWRLVNPQTMTQYQLLALLYSKVSRSTPVSVSAEENIYTHYENICCRSASWC